VKGAESRRATGYRYDADETKCTGMQMASDWNGEFWCTMKRESLTPGNVSKATSCGGIPLLQGGCLHVEGGSFQRITEVRGEPAH
jgi:hypothetical protein